MLYAVRLADLPLRVKGFVMRDEDDFNNIYINEHLGVIEQQKALLHELRHIEQGDFDSELGIPDIENIE